MASSLAGEALALSAVMNSLVYFKALLKDIFGDSVKNLPIVIYTDSRNLWRSLHSVNQVEDEWLIVDVAAIKEAMGDGIMTIQDEDAKK